MCRAIVSAHRPAPGTLRRRPLPPVSAPGAAPIASTPLCPAQACDVWEHSYYIDYRNKRPAYLTNFLDNLVNWEYVARKLADGSAVDKA